MTAIIALIIAAAFAPALEDARPSTSGWANPRHGNDGKYAMRRGTGRQPEVESPTPR